MEELKKKSEELLRLLGEEEKILAKIIAEGEVNKAEEIASAINGLEKVEIFRQDVEFYITILYHSTKGGNTNEKLSERSL